MKLRFFIAIAVLTVLAGWLVLAPDPAQALNPNHQCSFCHQLHQAPGTPLLKQNTFELVCSSCHDGTGSSKLAFVHDNDSSGSSYAYFRWTCRVCHDPHDGRRNRVYDAAFTHDHRGTGTSVNNWPLDGTGSGVNIKNVGPKGDGSGIAKIKRPLKVTNATFAAGTVTLTLAQNVYNTNTECLAVKVGDPITVSFVNQPITNPPNLPPNPLPPNPISAYDGDYTVTGVTCNQASLLWQLSYAIPVTPPAYTGGGYAQVGGTLPTSAMTGASWAVNTYAVTAAKWGARNDPIETAIVTIAGSHNIVKNNVITVSGVNPAGYNGTFRVRAVVSNQIQYGLKANPGTYVSGGSMSTSRATVTLSGTHTLAVGDSINVSGVNPAGYNGTFVVTAVNGNAITYNLLTDPGTYVSGGSMTDNSEPRGTLKPVVFESRGTDWGDNFQHSFADTDHDQDGVLDGPCEVCHTQTKFHLYDNFGDTHNTGKGCTYQCHGHDVGFERG